MYVSHFGCREQPFRITPDPHFFYANDGYEEVYANLLYGVRERKGFIVLTGEVGTGKTTLLRRLMDDLGAAVNFVFFYNTKLTFEEMLDFICQDFGLSVVPQANQLQKIQALNNFLLTLLARDGTGVLLIDEAQNLDDEVLENLRLLSNLETAREKLLQIVLVGQPELYQKLTQPHLRQLKQRVVVWCRLEALSDREVGAFINHRLRLAGCERLDLFSSEAVQRVAFYAKGTPRLINVICDNALLIAYGASQEQVSTDIVEEVAADLGLRERTRRRTWKPPTHSLPLSVQSPRPPLPTVNIKAEHPPLPELQSPSTSVAAALSPYPAVKERRKEPPVTATTTQTPQSISPLSALEKARRSQSRQIVLIASLVICILAVGGVLNFLSSSHKPDSPPVSTQLTPSSLEELTVSQVHVPSAPPLHSSAPPSAPPPQEASPTPSLEPDPEPPSTSPTPIQEQLLPSPSDRLEPSSQPVVSSQQEAPPSVTIVPTPTPPKQIGLATTSLQKDSPFSQKPSSQAVPDRKEQATTKTEEQSIQKTAIRKEASSTQGTSLQPNAGSPESTEQRSLTLSKREEARRELEKRGLTRYGSNVLTSAERGDTDTLGLLLAAGASPDSKDAKGWNALMLATMRGQTSAARTLLTNGANVNEKNEAGGTALMMAATKGDQDLIQELLKGGAAVNARNQEGWTPLMYAAWNGHGSAVRLLTDKKADVNARNQEGWTPLMCAASKGHTAVVQTLLSHGADARRQNKNGETALQLATRRGYTSIVNLLQAPKFDE